MPSLTWALPRAGHAFVSTESTANGRLALGALLVLALVVRLPFLTRNLWYDELYATHVILDGVVGTWHVIGSDTHPGFYTAFSYAWMLLFGDSEIAVRLPPLLLGLGSVGLIHWLANRWFGPATAFLASLLMAVSPVAIWYSQEAWPYSLEIFAALMLIRAYYGVVDATVRRLPWLFGYTAMALITVQTDYFLLAFPAVLTLLCHARRVTLRKTLTAINVLAALSLAAFLLAQYLKVGIVTDSYYLRPFTPYELWMLFFQWFSTGNALWSVNPYSGPAALLADPARLAAQVALGLVFLRGLMCVLRRSTVRTDVLLLLFAMPLPVMVLSVWPFSKIYIERGLIAALPLYLIVLAQGAATIRRPAAAIAVKGFLVALSAIAVIAMYAKPDDWTVYKSRVDWRSLATYLDSREPEAERMPIFSIAPATELSYYRPWIRAANAESTASLAGRDAELQRIAELTSVEPGTNPCDSATSRRTGGLFLVHNTTWDGGEFDAALTTVSRSTECQLQETQAFAGLEVFRFGRRDLSQ